MAHLWLLGRGDRLQICIIAMSVLNEHSQAGNRGWLSSLDVGQMADSSSLYKINMLQNVTKGLRCGQVVWEDRTGVVWLRVWSVMGCCEQGTEPAASVKCGEFLD